MATKIIAYIRPKDKLALVEQLRLVGNYLGNLKHQTVFEENRHNILTVLSFQMEQGDILVVPSASILSKNPMEQTATLEKFMKKNIRVIFARENIDLSTHEGIQYVRELQDSIADYRRKLAEVRGERGGRHKKYSKEQHRRAWELRQVGLTMDQIAKTMKVSPDQARYLWMNYQPEPTDDFITTEVNSDIAS